MDGDTVELECAGLGKLSFKVRDDLKRTWSRETRLDRQGQGFDTPTPQVSGKYVPAKSRQGPLPQGKGEFVKFSLPRLRGRAGRGCGYVACRFQPNQSHTPWPITSSRSLPFSHGNSSVNNVTHCR